MAKKRTNKEGSLRQRPNGLWELTVMIGYKEDGKRKRKSFYGKTQKEAKEKYKEFQRQQDLGLTDEKDITFAVWAKRWYEMHESEVSPTTYESYKYTLAILNDVFEHRKLREIKPLEVESFLRGLREEGKSDSYLSKCRGMLFQIMHKAEANDLILKNPVRFAEKMKRQGGVKEKEVFSSDELDLLMKHLPDNRIGHTIKLMIATGMRGQEMLALEVEHIAENGSMIYVRQAVKIINGKPFIGDTKSDGSTRDIPVPESFQYCARFLREQADDFVWHGKIVGQPFNPSSFRKKFQKALGEIEGVRILTPHCCRHTYITLMQSLGVDINTIRDLAGHADTKMTAHYIHVQQETLKRAADKLSDAFEY